MAQRIRGGLMNYYIAAVIAGFLIASLGEVFFSIGVALLLTTSIVGAIVYFTKN